MSITGLTGHIALAKQTSFGQNPSTLVINDFRLVQITGDSLAAANNMIVAEGEIGAGRDVNAAIPGGFSAAGAINGSLRARPAAVFLYGALGGIAAVTGPPAIDNFTPTDTLPLFTVEKKVGTNARTASELLTLQYTDTMVNTLNIAINSGGLSTFSAGLVSVGEIYVPAPLIDEQAAWSATTNKAGYDAKSNDLLVWHGGRIRLKDSVDNDNVTWVVGDNDTTFQSLEIAINNNVATDEYTIRPSRFLRSLTEGARSVEANITMVFEDFAKYQKYTYGATGRTAPGYNLYTGALDTQLANWQIIDADNIDVTAAPTGAPAGNAQGVRMKLPKAVFAGLPVTLATGRIAVTTSARALKPSTGKIMLASTLPSAAGF